MQKIVKFEQRIINGKNVYRKIVILPTDPTYAKELQDREEYFANKNKQKKSELSRLC